WPKTSDCSRAYPRISCRTSTSPDGVGIWRTTTWWSMPPTAAALTCSATTEQCSQGAAPVHTTGRHYRSPDRVPCYPRCTPSTTGTTCFAASPHSTDPVPDEQVPGLCFLQLSSRQPARRARRASPLPPDGFL